MMYDLMVNSSSVATIIVSGDKIFNPFHKYAPICNIV